MDANEIYEEDGLMRTSREFYTLFQTNPASEPPQNRNCKEIYIR